MLPQRLPLRARHAAQHGPSVAERSRRASCASGSSGRRAARFRSALRAAPPSSALCTARRYVAVRSAGSAGGRRRGPRRHADVAQPELAPRPAQQRRRRPVARIVRLADAAHVELAAGSRGSAPRAELRVPVRSTASRSPGTRPTKLPCISSILSWKARHGAHQPAPKRTRDAGDEPSASRNDCGVSASEGVAAANGSAVAFIAISLASREAPWCHRAGERCVDEISDLPTAGGMNLRWLALACCGVSAASHCRTPCRHARPSACDPAVTSRGDVCGECRAPRALPSEMMFGGGGGGGGVKLTNGGKSGAGRRLVLMAPAKLGINVKTNCGLCGTYGQRRWQVDACVPAAAARFK